MFTKSEGVNVNLTYDIQNFTDIGNFDLHVFLLYISFVLHCFPKKNLVFGSLGRL